MQLVTDRTQQNVARRNELARKGWANMTEAERREWTGSPLTAVGVNLIPPGPYTSDGLDVTLSGDDIVVKAKYEGIYLFASVILGKAADFQNKTFTLSVEGMEYATGSPKVEVYWHDVAGQNFAGGGLYAAGSSVSFDTTLWPNYANREYFALYIYGTTEPALSTGAEVRFSKIMLENGSTKHEYVPYAEVVPTNATKGAYNSTDLNRVERAVAEISQAMGIGLTTKTDWTMWDVPRASDMTRYLGNINAIKQKIGSTIPLPATMNKLDYTYANNIEKILLEAYEAM